PTGAPMDVHATPTSSTSLAISWRAPPASLSNGKLRGYSIELRQQDQRGSVTAVTRPVTGSLGGEQYTVQGLEPGALYEVAVRAFNRAGSGPLSSPRIIRATLPA
ncbi:Down syndrome cell adhesion molecule-like protein 1 homolog, partial [Hyalella azteca]|uniref:Down syndrome cell adhesion molecule-like protein 1 homolog n=1 Tax=Hyalella azteca TaxID=294128 RepID=A0A979FJV4_HYAAZ